MHHNTPQSVTSCTKRVFSQHVALLFLIVIDATRASVLSNCTLPVDIQLSRACSTTGTKLKVSLLCGCSVRRNSVQTKLKVSLMCECRLRRNSMQTKLKVSLMCGCRARRNSVERPEISSLH